MGSKVQAELGRQPGVSYQPRDTWPLALGTAPGPGFPIGQIPERLFFFTSRLKRHFWLSLPGEVRWSQRQN